MELEFESLKRGDLKAASRMEAQAYEDYEYFTCHFPTKKERRKTIGKMIYRGRLTYFGLTHYLIAKAEGKIVAVVQLDDPDCKRPSDLQFILHGWLMTYIGTNRRHIDDWVEMDKLACKPCHDYQKDNRDAWYISSISVASSAQGKGVGSRFLAYVEDYVREHGGRQLVLFTNSEKNLAFYLHNGFEVFYTETITYEGRSMESWSMKKTLG